MHVGIIGYAALLSSIQIGRWLRKWAINLFAPIHQIFHFERWVSFMASSCEARVLFANVNNNI